MGVVSRSCAMWYLGAIVVQRKPKTDQDEPVSKGLTKYVTVLQAANMLGVGRIQASYLLRQR